jgi:acid phosphatase
MTFESLNRREVLQSLGATAVMSAVPQAFGRTADSTLKFLVVGDWGRNGSNHQRDVGLQMGKVAARQSANHVISVGDNFYEDGVQSTGDPQWHSSYEDIYDAESLQIPWYVALGNHDYRGVPQAQLDYSKASARWRMPSRYYKLSGGSLGFPHIDMFVTDTSPLVHKYRENVQSVIARNVADQDVAAQLSWLDEQLGRSTTPWKIVIGHHTVHSGGSGHGDTPEMNELIEPLLKKHGVQAYINGHDHDLQHIRRQGVDYVCCGAGSEVRPVMAVEGTLFCAARSGFAAMRSSPASLSFEFFDYTGARIYRADIPGNAASQRAA